MVLILRLITEISDATACSRFRT